MTYKFLKGRIKDVQRKNDLTNYQAAEALGISEATYLRNYLRKEEILTDKEVRRVTAVLEAYAKERKS